MRYLAQCVSGLQDVVARQLECEPFEGLEVLRREEGLVVFETQAQPRSVRALPYVNNTFMVLGEAGGLSIEAAVKRLATDERWLSAAAKATTPKERTFRLVLSDGGELVGAPRAMTQAMEALGRACKLRVSPRQADAELWLLRRASGSLFFCKRLSKRAKTERDLEKGELRPELAHLMALLSEPARSDVVLDPFCGSGALPLARAQLPYDMILCVDSSAEKVAAVRAKVKGDKDLRRRRPIIARVGDARRLERTDDGFIHKIITDPPWGYYDQELADVPGFYREVLAELCRVLKEDGLLVLLLGRRDLVEGLLADFADRLTLEARHDLLVSGKKAALLKLRRRSSS